MAATMVTVQRVSCVLPATPTERQKMFLTTCDLVCRTYPYINRIFFYECKLDSYHAVVCSLQESLARTLVQFFPVAGRFSYDEEGRLQIDCNDEGVDFVEAAADCPLRYLQDDGFQHRSLFWKLARRTSLLRSDYLHLPILSIQVTQFLDGGLALGVSLSHVVVDAQSFYDFVKCWADNCRGAAMSVPPKHMRTALSVESLFPVELDMGMVKPVAAVLGAQQGHEKVSRRAQAPIIEKQHEQEEHRPPRTDLVQKVFTFNFEMLQRLKAKAASGASKSFTTFESFCAHWWQSLIRARCLPAAQPVFLLIPINCRQRFLNLPEGYFGNALDGGLVKATAGELCAAELAVVAGKIHDSIAAVTEDSFREYIREAESKRAAIPHFDRTELFHIADAPRFRVYDTDFGWGPPKAVRVEGLRFGAEVQILAGRLGKGSYDMCCALDADSMDRLEHDSDFMAC